MPSTTPDSSPSGDSGLAWLLRVVCLVGASAGFAALWVILVAATDRQNGWMALLGALDVVWVLRLTGWPPGPSRMWSAVAATALVVVLANWWSVAVQLGYALGYSPLDSIWRLGANHTWTLVQLVNGPLDALLIGASLVLAALLSR